MTQLTDIMDIQDLDIRSLQEVASEGRRKTQYGKYLEFEKSIIDKGVAPSFSAYLLYEHQFNGKNIAELAEDIGVEAGSVRYLMRKMKIPRRNNSESRTGKSLSQQHRVALSKALKGKVLSDETRRKISEALSGHNHPNYGRFLSEEHRKAIRHGMIGKSPWDGKHLSEETKLKISRTLFNNPNKRYNARRGGLVGGLKKMEKTKLNSYYVESRFYAFSQQEGAVALLLEKYVPNYVARDGISCQIRDRGIKKGGIDFLVNGEFFEWHPIQLCSGGRGDIPKEELDSYKKIASQIPEAELEEFVRDYAQVLAVNYRNKRQEAVDNSGYSGASLSLATAVRELYDFIAGHGGNLPAFDDFKREFNREVKYVKGFKVEKQEKPAELAEVGK
ncbi:MAG: hypothetical protein KKE50_03960 [Nanoarchaeota archaeon]|nr:hypothetical protein [Nanoarchaeota archaeon]